MSTVLGVVAAFIGQVAAFGAGFMSIGLSYQPELPEELK